MTMTVYTDHLRQDRRLPLLPASLDDLRFGAREVTDADALALLAQCANVKIALVSDRATICEQVSQVPNSWDALMRLLPDLPGTVRVSGEIAGGLIHLR